MNGAPPDASADSERPTSATAPEQLHPLWRRFAGERDAEGLAGLYEADALVVAPGGRRVQGRAEILAFYRTFVGGYEPQGRAQPRAPLVQGDLALTSMQEGPNLTCEVARRQADGTWLWVIDTPEFARDVG